MKLKLVLLITQYQFPMIYIWIKYFPVKKNIFYVVIKIIQLKINLKMDFKPDNFFFFSTLMLCNNLIDES